MNARRKSIAQDAPTSLEESRAMLARYRNLSAVIALNQATAEKRIADINIAVREANAPIEAELKTLFAGLRTWWAVAGKNITGVARRSTEIDGIEIGLRRTPPALKLAKGLTVADAITWLRNLGNLGGFVRVKYELNKPALIKEVLAKPDGSIAQKGFSAPSKDEFYIALRPLEAPKTEPAPSE